MRKPRGAAILNDFNVKIRNTIEKIKIPTAEPLNKRTLKSMPLKNDFI